MEGLNRHLAPISTEAWREIDEQARAELRLVLAGRRVADVTGPLGWSAAAVSTGRVESLTPGPVPGVVAAVRRTQPLVEVRSYFDLSRQELDALERGARDADLDPVTDAARAAGYAEDRAMFHGYPAAGIEGIFQSAAAEALAISADYTDYPSLVSRALARLRRAGVGGPYAIALGPRCYTGLSETTFPGGFPVVQHVERLIDGPVIWAPAISGAVVLSLRGGDFELTLGRDFSIGYHRHTDQTVTLYLEESFTFRSLAPEAAVPLVYEDEWEHEDQKLDEALDETFPASDPISV